MKAARGAGVFRNWPLAAGARLLRRRVRDNAPYRAAFVAMGCLSGGMATLRAEVSVPIPTEVGSGVTIRVMSPLTAVPRFGFMPLRVTVDNLTTAEGTWRFRFETGSARLFPGLASSTLEVTVPAQRNRETWFYLPIAEPGISFNPAVLSATGGPMSPTLPSTPPVIAGVYPNPKIPGVTHEVRSSIASGPQGLTRTFTITQIGPGNLLPEIPAARLPNGATSTVARRASDGNVTRMTTVPITVPRGGLSFAPSGSMMRAGASSPAPSIIAMTNARNALARAGLNAPNVRTSSSVHLGTTTGGLQDATVTLRQTGPAASLPLPPTNTLPPGFTAVQVTPDSADGSSVTREFTYVEKVSAQPMVNIGPTNAWTAVPTMRPRLPSEMQTDARRALAPTKLLETPSSVKLTVTTQGLSLLHSPTLPSTMLIGQSIVLFEQTGPARELPLPGAASLPPGVRATVMPAAAGQVTRIISYIDPATLAAIVASGSVSAVQPIQAGQNIARTELQRGGFLRTQAGVTVSGPVARPAAAGVPGSFDTVVFTETGPAAVLPEPPAAQLPPGITCTITPAALAGDVSRNFVVNVPALLAGVSATVPLPARSGPASPRVTTGTMLNPPTMMVEVTGPGLQRGATRVHFPNSIANTAMPPLAASLSLEQAVRGKFATHFPRAVPNVAGVEPAQLPADWRLWSSFNAVLLESEAFALLDPARRGALRSWVAMGGVLLLAPEAAGAMTSERVGAGRIETLAAPVGDLAPGEMLSRLQLTTAAPGMPERERMTLMAGTTMGDVVTFAAPDTLWISLLLVAFALLVGPLNVYWLAPATKRHRLFLTTPLLSVAGALTIAAAIVLQDGLGGEGRRRTLVLLVPGENQAAVFQEQGARTGFLSRRDFQLEPGAICSVLPVDGNVFMALGVGANFSRDAESAAGDWFRNRSRQAHLLRALAPTRARVEVVGAAADGAPLVESTVATELKDFRLRDDRGGIWSAASVPTGRRTALRSESRFAAAASASLEAGGNGTANLNELVKEASTLSEPWQWVARGGAIDVAPIATLKSVRWEDDPIVFAGVALRAPGAGRAAQKGAGE